MFETVEINKIRQSLKQKTIVEKSGKITQVVGMVIESEGPKVPIGEVCILKDKKGNIVTRTEIVGFKDNNKILSMVLGNTENISPGMEIVATGKPLTVNVGDGLLGRVIDGVGNPLDNLGPIEMTTSRSIYAEPPNPLNRKRISEPITTGVRAIDGLITFGKGQRVGIFAGSGVGKSTTIGMIARNSSADVNVISLIGERGREVREFIEKDLGKEGLERSIVVCATGDTPALLRIKSALLATSIAEYFRDKGLDVILMMDSVTRLAMAQREVGLTIGEPPTTKGYTPSVFSLMQKTMERAGTSDVGSITGLYTVLVEGDDMNEPIADTARGILDGHIVLARKLASAGHFPAIDVLESISRVKNDVISSEQKSAAAKIIEMMAIYKDVEDLISVGAYKSGINPKVDKAIVMHEPIIDFLRQGIGEGEEFDNTLSKMNVIVSS